MPTLMLLKDGEAIGFRLTDDVTVLGRARSARSSSTRTWSRAGTPRSRETRNDYFVEDLGSGNGTFLNGKRVNERTPLKANDRLKLGPILLRFETGTGPASPGLAVGKEVTGVEITATTPPRSWSRPTTPAASACCKSSRRRSCGR